MHRFPSQIVAGVSALALVAALAFALVAAAPTAADAQKPIVIGGAISVTGKYAEPAGRLRDGRLLWMEEANKRGGLLGRPVKLIMRDDRSDPQTSIKLYERLITQENVDLCLAPYSSAITEAVASTIERYKCPIIADGAATTSIWQKGRKWVFGLVGPSKDYLRGGVDIAAKNGWKRIAIIGADTLFPKAAADGATRYAKKRGLKVVLRQDYPKAQTDFRPLLLRVRALRADVLLAATYFPDAVAITRQLKELNINLKFFAGTVGPGLPKFAKSLGPTAEYVMGSTQWEPVPALGYPGMKEFIAKFKKRFGYTPNYHAAQGYGVMLILEEAIKRAGSFDRAAIREQLLKLDMTTHYGPYKVDPKTGLQIAKKLLMFQIINGKRRIVWPDEAREMEPKVPVPAWDKRPRM